MPIDQDTMLRTLLSDRARVLAYIRSIVRRHELAEDIFQDVCVLALEKRDTIVDEQHLAAWLRTAARLRAMNVLRKKQTHQRTLDESVLDRIEQQWKRHDDSGSDLAEMLGGCLNRLSAKARQLIQARYGDGLTVAQIADRDARPVSSLYVALSRVHAALADCVFRVNAGRKALHD